jgi:uncharacterized protein YecE (DUF72 family)
MLRLERESERVLVFMNNPWRGQAVINARMLMEQLQEITNGSHGRSLNS